jgi:hypothetical protein
VKGDWLKLSWVGVEEKSGARKKYVSWQSIEAISKQTIIIIVVFMAKQTAVCVIFTHS